jgi:hypothetical protein
LTKNKPTVRKRIFYVSFILTGLSFFSLLTNISTTISELDWIIVSSIYFSIALVLCWTQFQTKKPLKIIGVIFIIFTFGLGYILGTVGELGVDFVFAEFKTDTEKYLGDGLIYKESSLEYGFHDFRGKRVEIYRTISWFPIIEWRTRKKEYFSLFSPGSHLTADYRPTENKIFLSLYTSKGWWQDLQKTSWSDTLNLGQ